jgi:CheY-like chemotaxis protein
MMAMGESRIRAVRGSGLLIDENTKIEKSKTGRILIADSEEVNLKLLQSLFFNENYEVKTCKDGITALEAAKITAFDAILVERNAAKLDGMMMKQLLGESPLNAKTLFILLTYNKNPDIVTHANQLGIDFVIQKPVIFEEIAGLIERAMKKGGTR